MRNITYTQESVSPERKNTHFVTDSNVNFNNRKMLDLDSHELKELYRPKEVSKDLSISKIISSITNNKSKNKNFDVSNFESASTLQQSSIGYTIPKTKRFRESFEHPLIDSVYQTINKPDKYKGAYIGYGNKDDLYIKSSLEVPASNQYNLISIFDKNLEKKKGISMAKKYYHKDKFSYPGPGSYEQYNLNTGKYPITIKERNSFFQDDIMKSKVTVSPQRYYPSYQYIFPNRYKGIGIGMSERNMSNSNLKYMVGPGSHNLPPIFGKTQGERPPLN